MRTAGLVIVILLLFVAGLEGYLFVRANSAWVAIHLPIPWAYPGGSIECESPTWFLCMGWVVTALLLGFLCVRLPRSLARRRKMKAEVERLQAELDLVNAERRGE